MFEKICALIAIVGGGFGSLIAWNYFSLEKWVSPDEMQQWHDKYGKIVKILGPVAVVVGLILLIISFR